VSYEVWFGVGLKVVGLDRNLESEKNQEIKRLNKIIKEVEKQKKIIQAKDKQYQHTIRKMELFTKKLQDALDKTRSTKIIGKSITPSIHPSKTVGAMSPAKGKDTTVGH
jgi:hypothetical protein